MTDRHAGYIVTLKDDIREDDADFILNAIRMIKGVVGVEPIISSAEIHLAQTRITEQTRMSLHRAVDEVFRRNSNH
jgi:hypothetical protein